jgi:hypothetical protein
LPGKKRGVKNGTNIGHIVGFSENLEYAFFNIKDWANNV